MVLKDAFYKENLIEAVTEHIGYHHSSGETPVWLARTMHKSETLPFLGTMSQCCSGLWRGSIETKKTSMTLSWLTGSGTLRYQKGSKAPDTLPQLAHQRGLEESVEGVCNHRIVPLFVVARPP